MKIVKTLCVFMLLTFVIVSFVSCKSEESKNAELETTENSGVAGKKEDTQHVSEKSEPQQIAEGRQVTLLVDLHGWMPTVNTEPTAENPNVFLSTQKIADEFMKIHKNINIQWARTKPVGALEQDTAQWFTTQIAAGDCPAIAFSWGTKYQDRDWYDILDDVIDTPNEYVEGNSKWREMFPEYLFKHLTDVKQQLVAIPITVFSGPPTGYFYNKNIFEELKIQPPKNWEELGAMVKKVREKGYIPVYPWGFFKKIELNQWCMQFSVGPAFAGAIMDKTDYNKDGIVDASESLRGVKEGYYNPVEHEYAREMFRQLKRYYNEFLEKGWENTDYYPSWNEGKVAVREEGMWALQAENNNKERKFEFGAFPVPIVTKETSEYVADIKFTEKGPYQPLPDFVLNIMKPAVKDKKDVRDAAVAFLKFLTKPENISMMILEQGASLGAVKGTEIPPLLSDWMNQSFPIIPRVSWPLAFTDEQNNILNKEFEMWVKNSMNDTVFFDKVNKIQQRGADDYIRKMDIDTNGWDIKK